MDVPADTNGNANGAKTAEEALLESRPPATDSFTYLTIIEKFLSPEILPTLNTVLQDASLTQEIGWDLVHHLVAIPGSEPCLETVARLGNPREVIVKALEVLEGFPEDVADEIAGDEDEEGAEQQDGKDVNRDETSRDGESSAADTAAQAESSRRFITLLGMLAILHKRIKTKYPSRFLASTLLTVRRAYRPTQKMTASVINLVQSLAGHRRPPLPTRTSSVDVANPDRYGDTSRNAPDPEAEPSASPEEVEIQERLLLAFVLAILESYVNANPPAWAERLIETYEPRRIVPGKRTALQAFKEDQELLGRDAIVGQLAALARDLGLSSCSKDFLSVACRDPVRTNTLPDADELKGAQDVRLPTGGAICLLAYWAFSSAVFEATTSPLPEAYIFPDHFSLLQRYMEDDAQSQILDTPGTIEAILALGLWLQHDGRLLPPSSSTTGFGESPPFMPYHHLLTLCSVYHPSLGVRNAASTLAGSVLHADPDEDDRLRILEDLLENCMFAALKACAITWLREELVAAAAATTTSSTARAPSSSGGLGLLNVAVVGGNSAVESNESSTSSGKDRPKSRGKGSLFAGPEAVEQLQYWIFPDLQFVREMDRESFVEYWAQNSPFVLQAANFAYFLFKSETYRALFVPRGMIGAVEERYVRPLLAAASAFAAEGQTETTTTDHEHDSPNAQLAMELSILTTRLESLLSTST